VVQTYRARLAAATATLSAHDVADAERHLEPAPEDLRDWEWRHLRARLDDSSAMIPLANGENGVLSSGPDRRRLGISSGDGLRLTDLDGGGQVTVPIRPVAPHAVTAAETRLRLRVAVWFGGAIDVFEEAGGRTSQLSDFRATSSS
jgi:hypothetical protein